MVLTRRWVVEPSWSWIMRARRHCRGHERLPEMSESLITWAAITLMTRRLARKGVTSAGRGNRPLSTAGRQRSAGRKKPQPIHLGRATSSLAMRHQGCVRQRQYTARTGKLRAQRLKVVLDLGNDHRVLTRHNLADRRHSGGRPAPPLLKRRPVVPGQGVAEDVCQTRLTEQRGEALFSTGKSSSGARAGR